MIGSLVGSFRALKIFFDYIKRNDLKKIVAVWLMVSKSNSMRDIFLSKSGFRKDSFPSVVIIFLLDLTVWMSSARLNRIIPQILQANKSYKYNKKNKDCVFFINTSGMIFDFKSEYLLISGFAIKKKNTAIPLRFYIDGRLVDVGRCKRSPTKEDFPCHSEECVGFNFTIISNCKISNLHIMIENDCGRWLTVYNLYFKRSNKNNKPFVYPQIRKILLSHKIDQIHEMKQHVRVFIRKPKILVVIDARRHVRRLNETIESIENQIYPFFKIVVLSLYKIKLKNKNIENIISNSLSINKIHKIEWVMILYSGDILKFNALYEFAACVNHTRELDFIYSDDERFLGLGAIDPFYKPDWSPDYLESFNYIGRSGLYKVELLKNNDIKYESLYDFILRMTEKCKRVFHIKEILLSESVSEIIDDEGIIAIQGRLNRTGREGEVVKNKYGSLCYDIVLRPSNSPSLVSIIIPTGGKTIQVNGKSVNLITNVVGQLINNTSYKKFEIIVVDNGDLTNYQISTLSRFGCRIVTYKEQIFNISKKFNLGAKYANGKFLLLLNDDIEIKESGWLGYMLSHMEKPEVGVVGAMLLYPEGQIQHAGVALSHGRPDHIYRLFEPLTCGYFNTLCSSRNMLAVTGACMLVRSDVYSEISGYTEALAVSFNDIDFCMKARDAGYRVVFEPRAILTHMESVSRKPSLDENELNFYLNRWTTSCDPFYNERFLNIFPPRYVPTFNQRQV